MDSPTNRCRLLGSTSKRPGLGQIAVANGSFLKDIDLFDHIEFGISAKDARALSPATRKLLEHSFLALLDSGIDYRRRAVGCYMAGTAIDITNVSFPDDYEPHGSFGGLPSMIANRISNHLDLLGPSVPVDTACSSSMTAMHIAVQALGAGDCEAAVVGGCQLNHRLLEWMNYSQGGLLPKDGKCKPFDASADGFGRAEGCVVVVIKPLEDALRDHDHIYATILGTSINSTGAGGPPGAPVAEYQAEAMKQAFQRAGRNPSEVAYVELHATGTAKGDPTEVNWVGQHFQRPEELVIGSVKGNIG
ncbi:thiolase-like protein [Roridomyces roridus]|uniref:Thiolase-like protein n=1 Tax=Roridomyces roridus TaxID=1738132 RepID=A0AAD7BS92_9AGAR|nr:thiolase-like protein [Roridomyces roridus]